MSKKILVLENTEGISELLNISIPNDYDVLSATNGSEALEIIQKSNPPLLIFDIQVPDMDGIEFLCKVKKQSPHTQMITIVGADQLEKGVTSLRYDASDYIPKPVTSEALETALERAEEKLAIKKRLSPATGDVFPSLVHSERESLAKQMISIVSENTVPESGLMSGMVSLHARNGVILKTSDEHKKLFGNMEGKKSWDIYKRGTASSDDCPSAQAFKSSSKHVSDMVVVSKDGKDIEARVCAAPLINHQDQTDLVIVILTL